jgi:CheY-like chemotaxis protein
MRMLLIEDSRVGTTITTAMLSQFGEVRAARTIDEARAVMASGFRPDVIVTDLNLGDHRRWQETVADVVTLASGRPILAQTGQTWPELLDEFARLFSAARAELFSKRDERGMLEWLRQFREDQSGHMVQTMDRGSKQSHTDIRSEVRAYFEALGVPKPADEWLGLLFRCIVRWQARADAAGELVWRTLVVGAVAAAVGWFGWAVREWLLAGMP